MLSVAVAGCHAQTKSPAVSAARAEQAGVKLSPALARRVEVMIRSRSQVPPQYVMSISNRTKSEIPGYDKISVTFSANGNTTRPLTFLLSTDDKTLAQFNKYDLSQDPRDKVSAVGRPARGGPANAPGLHMGFDTLENTFCSKMNAQLFPALLNRYKDEVRIVYRDFPLSQHPWAMHAAVDANCLADGSQTAYWNYVDTVHAHAAEMGGEEKSLAKAEQNLDKIALGEGASQKMNATVLEACVQKQDDSKINESIKEAEALGVDSTPALFINGEKVEGVVPMEYIYRIIDRALVAEGKTPPPEPSSPETEPAGKPGN